MTPSLGTIVVARLEGERGKALLRPAVVMASLADVGGGLDLHVLLSPRDIQVASISRRAHGLALFLANAAEGDAVDQWRPLSSSTLETS